MMIMIMTIIIIIIIIQAIEMRLKKEVENILKYKYLTIEIQNVKTKMI